MIDTTRLQEYIEQIESGDKRADELIIKSVNEVDEFEELADVPFNPYKKLVNGYLVYYGQRCINAAVKGGTTKQTCHTKIFGVYEPISKKSIRDEKILDSIRESIRPI